MFNILCVVYLVFKTVKMSNMRFYDGLDKVMNLESDENDWVS